LEEKLETLERDFYSAYWDSQVEASPESDARRAEYELEIRRLKGDRAALDVIESELKGDVHDGTLRRRLEVLRLLLLEDQMGDDEREQLVTLGTEVESEFATFRPQVNGRRLSENDVGDILRDSDDEAERRAAYLASKEIGARVAQRVRELARVRNSAARELGFADFYTMQLEVQEISEDWLFGILGELEELTQAPFAAWKEKLDERLRARFNTDVLYPWHYADPFFQELPPDGSVTLDDVFGDASATDLALKTFAAWGIDLTKVVEGSDLYPREKKCQHAFCISIDRQDDVRMLCNVVPGERWVEVMLHESGHAAFDISIDRHLPFLLRTPAHTFVTEAIALLSGRLARDPRWLQDIAGIDSSVVDGLADRLRRASATQSMQFARWGLVMVHFERALYADPEADLDAIWWELVERFQLLRRPEDPPSGAWAAKIHVAAAPVYYHNYLLGDMLASQLTATAKAEFGGLVGSEAAGRMLIERVFRPGNLMRWDSLVESATGKPLSASDFVRGLVEAQ
jgi:peptidyl-dipeptidase A